MEKQTQQYDEGVAAFDSGADQDSCPYPIIEGGSFRYWWLTGYWDRKLQVKYPHLFAKEESDVKANAGR